MKRRFWLCPLTIVVLLLIFFSACKKTVSNPYPNTVADYDGNVYHTLQIGSQTWMLENLIVTHDRHGNTIANITDSSLWPALTSAAYCAYGNNTDTVQQYGLLYNWYAAADTAIAPTGFHVATNLDWDTLVAYLGGDSVAGGKLKQTDTVTWYSNNLADSSCGFNAIPCGYFINDTSSYSTFQNLNFAGYWWTSTEGSPGHAWYRYIYGFSTAIYENDDSANESWGLGIRCVKNK